MFRLLFFLAALYLLYSGIKKIFIKNKPFSTPIAALEAKMNKEDDYFILDGCSALSDYGYYTYDRDKPGIVKQYFMGLYSEQALNEAKAEFVRMVNNYVVDHNLTINELSDEVYDSIQKLTITPPQVFLQSANNIDISTDDYLKMLEDIQNKQVSGIRLQSGIDLESEIKEGLEKDGIKLNDKLILLHNQTPSDSRSEGIFSLILGLVILLFVLYPILTSKTSKVEKVEL